MNMNEEILLMQGHELQPNCSCRPRLFVPCLSHAGPVKDCCTDGWIELFTGSAPAFGVVFESPVKIFHRELKRATA